MAIIKKDGTIYKLNGPNRIMKTQVFWDGYQLHNLAWEEEVKSDKKEIVRQISDFRIKVEKHLPPVQNPPTEVPRMEQKEQRPEITNMFCLPAIYEDSQDPLYNESRPKMRYGEKFIFESIIFSQGDFVISFWTNIEIENESIVFPINRDKRWWKINKRETKEKGYSYQAIPSSTHPDFT